MIKIILRCLTIAFAVAIIFLSIIMISKSSRLKELEEATSIANTSYTITEKFEIAEERDELKDNILELSLTFSIINIVESVLVIATLIIEFTLKNNKTKEQKLNKYR